MAEFAQTYLNHFAVAEFVSPSPYFAEPSLKYFLKDTWTVGFNIFSQIHLTSKDNTLLCYCLAEQLLWLVEKSRSGEEKAISYRKLFCVLPNVPVQLIFSGL